MSIIQEALKRKEEEEGFSPNEETVSPPPLPPSSKKQGKSKGPWITVLVAVLVLVVAGGVIVFLLHAGLSGILGLQGADDRNEGTAEIARKKEGSETAVKLAGESDSKLGSLLANVQKTIEVAADNAAEEGSSPASMQDQVVPPAENEKQKSGASEKVAQSGVEEAGSTEQQGEKARAQKSEDASGPKNTGGQSEPEKKEQKAGKAKAESVDGSPKNSDARMAVGSDWPKIHVKGILATGGKRGGTVLLGAEMLSEGDSYKGAKILNISSTQVLLEYEGEERELHSGQIIGAD